VLVAGVDVGNSTTEVAVARVEPGREPEWLFVGRRPTTGAKGSVECVGGITELLLQAERRLGARPQLCVLAELNPVRTGLLEFGSVEELALERTAIARPGSQTPSGEGVGTGRLTSLADLRGARTDRDVIAVVGREDFDTVGAALRDARERGWRITAAIVEGDDGVLIGNRFDRSLPIVDEVEDLAELPLGALAAVEVAPDGASVDVLSDPLRLGLLLGFNPQEALSPAAAPRSSSRPSAPCAALLPRARR
jgi:diol dehydratase reactivase alpha subunit